MMRKGTLILLAFIVLLAGFHSLYSVGQNRPANQDIPVVDSSNTEGADSKRQAKGRRYDRPKSLPITEMPIGDEVLPLNVHPLETSPLPVVQSDAIVLGQVLDGKAYLSNNRTAVYSEFSILIEEILKNPQQPLSSGQLIIGERWGGAVRFPSGKVQHYVINDRGMPQRNEKYIFFLKCNEEDYDIITAYRLIEGRIDPLDGGPPFEKYQNAAAQSFLAELHALITSSLSPKGSN